MNQLIRILAKKPVVGSKVNANDIVVFLPQLPNLTEEGIVALLEQEESKLPELKISALVKQTLIGEYILTFVDQMLELNKICRYIDNSKIIGKYQLVTLSTSVDSKRCCYSYM